MFCCVARPRTADSPLQKKGPNGPGIKQVDSRNAGSDEPLIGTAVDAESADRAPEGAEQQPGDPVAAEEEPGPQLEQLEQQDSAASAAPLLAAEPEAVGEGGGGSEVGAASNAADEAEDVNAQGDEDVNAGPEALQQDVAAGHPRSDVALGNQDAADAAAADAAAAHGVGDECDSQAAELGQLDGAGSRACSDAASTQQEHSSLAQDSSQAALLGADDPSHISLKQPRFSRLSGLLSCGTSRLGDDDGETHSRQLQEAPQPGPQQQQQPQQPQGWPPELDFDAAAAELVLLPRDKLLPLAQPEQALADAAGMLGRQEVAVLLSALLTLRRVAIHHAHLLDESLEDVSQVLLECLHGSDAAVAQAGLLAMLDMLVSFGGGMLRHLEHAGGLPQYSCLLALLVAAARGRTPAIRHWANEALRFMAERLPQGRVIRALERYLDHPLPHVRSKAAEWLMVATYRRPDSAGSSGTSSRPGSPAVKPRGSAPWLQ